jgi:diguanylate cyclase (GGDEF)-like protein
MNLLELFQTHEPGIKVAVAEAARLMVLWLTCAIVSFIGYFIGFDNVFLTSKRFSIYDMIIIIPMSVATSIWITSSIMRRAASEAKKQSLVDPVTGLLNLRAFNEQLPLAMQERRKTAKPISLIIFDIDNFKEVNTLIGYNRANVALKATAELLNPRAPDQLFRHSKSVERETRRAAFRYGGDEFIVIAFNTAVDGSADLGMNENVFNGTTLAERLQENVWKMNCAPLVEARKQRGLSTRLTVSAGIADSQAIADRVGIGDELLRRAERALMEAKRLNAQDPRRNESFRGRIVRWSSDLRSL